MRNFIARSLPLFAAAIASLSATATLQAVTYQYDDAGRLTAAIYDNGSAVRYAYDTAGNIISVSSVQAPATPNDVSISQVDDGALVSWSDAASNEIGYIVQRRSSGTDVWTNIASLAPGSTSYLDPGVIRNNNYTYRVIARGSVLDSAYSLAATVGEQNPRLINLSSRARVGFGNDVMIAGFFVGGENTKRVVIRAVGPTLETLIPNFPGELPNPALDLRDGDQNQIASNDDWGNQPGKDEIAQAFASVGAFPLDDGGKDAALMVDLKPGLYSAIVSSETNDSGIALTEIYDLSDDESTRLLNISTRVKVGQGDNVLIGGFVVREGEQSKFLIRAIGPRLSDFGLPDALADPQVNLVRTEAGANTVIAANDDWGDTPNAGDIPAATTAAGGFQLLDGSRDAVLLVDLEPGIYSASVSGVNGANGIALIEIYAVP